MVENPSYLEFFQPIQQLWLFQDLYWIVILSFDILFQVRNVDYRMQLDSRGHPQPTGVCHDLDHFEGTEPLGVEPSIPLEAAIGCAKPYLVSNLVMSWF